MLDAKQDERLVTQQFDEQAAQYAQEWARNSKIVPFLLSWLEARDASFSGQSPARICEFGGGGGMLLTSIHERFGDKAKLYNAELVAGYRDYQTSDAIQFVQTSMLCPSFNDNTFEVVFARHVLHHLIGKTLSQARVNQQHAIDQLLRITKPGGVLLLEEQVNQSQLAAEIIYHLSRLASRMKLRIEAFEVTPYTVIAYLTREQLIALCQQALPRTHWIADEYLRRDMDLRWKVTLLMSNNGDAFIAMQKPA